MGEKRKKVWYYYHSYGSHRTIHNPSHMAYNTDSDIITTSSSSRMVVTLSSMYEVYQYDAIIRNNQQHHPILRSCLDSWGNGWGWARARTRTRQQIHQVGWYNETSSSTNRLIHHYRFVVHTNTIIYNNQQQQKNKNKKERGKECY